MSLSAKRILIADRSYVCHLYSASQAFDILLLLGEALAEPLSRLVGREVSSDLGDIAEAVNQLSERGTVVSDVLQVFGALRKVGGHRALVDLLQTTSYEDRPIDSRKRFDEVFQGPAGLVQASQLLWEVLQFQLGPLFDAAQPLLSERLRGLAAKGQQS